jgi:hypothetical protein
MEGMESCDVFLQVTQASATHSVLHTIASETDKYPKGRETTNTAGMKTKATTRKATVVVYPVPVDFLDASNMQPPRLTGWPKKRDRNA